MPYASVFPLLSTRALVRPFSYEVGEEVAKGSIVTMQFGRRRARGVVPRSRPRRRPGSRQPRSTSVVGAVPPALVDLALWIAEYYGSTPARALGLVAPEFRRRRGLRPPPAERQSLPGEARPAALRDEQRAACDRIGAALAAGEAASFLLYGPTGSGKTEVYLQAVEAALSRDRGAIVLVPEIALAPQTLGRVRARFGDRVAVLHSAWGKRSGATSTSGSRGVRR